SRSRDRPPRRGPRRRDPRDGPRDGPARRGVGPRVDPRGPTRAPAAGGAVPVTVPAAVRPLPGRPARRLFRLDLEDAVRTAAPPAALPSSPRQLRGPADPGHRRGNPPRLLPGRTARRVRSAFRGGRSPEEGARRG